MKFFALLSVALAATPAVADNQAATMWQLSGDTNSIYILGSVHLLRESDYPIPSLIYDVYDEAETLIMELDMDDLDPFRTQALVTELGMMQEGQSLRLVLGKRDYSRAIALAEEMDIPLGMMERTEPWLAAVMVETLMLTRLGFDPAHGIEMHLLDKARRDSKEVLGLETERQQLEILDNLSSKAQKEMLLQTLAEGAQIGELMDRIIEAWRQGDVAYMEETLLGELLDNDELHRAIVVERNRNWVQQIDGLLDDKDDYLIIVGTLHLVGEDSVPALLRERGHDVSQMH